MIQEYINKALAIADYKILEDGTWFADIKPLSGVWANGESIEETRQELIEVIEEWLLLKLKDGDEIPVLGAVKCKGANSKFTKILPPGIMLNQTKEHVNPMISFPKDVKNYVFLGL